MPPWSTNPPKNKTSFVTSGVGPQEKNVGWPGDGQLGLEFAFCGYSPVKSLKKKRKALRGVMGVLLVAWPWGVSVARAQKHQSKKPGTHV